MRPRIGLASLALAAFLCAVLAGAVYGAAQTFSHLPLNLGFHGWLALVGGAVLTVLLSCGLMGLVFLSARRGHDETHPPDPEN